MRIIVSFSGGKDSQACLIKAVRDYGKENVMAVFCDTSWEHPITYKHVDDVCNQLGVKLIKLKNGKVNGFHDKEYSDEHYLMLIITEIAEAVEADRKGKNAEWVILTSLYNYTFVYEYPHNSPFRYDFEKYIKDTKGDEIADICIRIFDFAGLKGIELILSNQPHIKYEYGDIIRRQLFTEFAFKLTGSITFCPVETSLSFVINRIIDYCDIHGIDLKKHIELKMKYNEMRPFKNGKNY